MTSAQRYLLAIDQGTTGSTVMIVDTEASGGPRSIGHATVDFPQHYPRAGWVEHDLEDVWRSVDEAARRALEKARVADPAFSAGAVAAIGITNQRETLCLFERKTARPAARAVVWQDKRSTDLCQKLKDQGHEKAIRERTGLVIDPYFTGTKITWLMQNAPALAARLRSGEVVLGTIDTYLIARLTGGEAFVTEPSNASRTLLYDIHRGAWSDELLDRLEVPGRACLPEVRDSAGLFGKTRGAGFLPDGVPITGVLGDQQAALAGQACFAVGEAKCTYGTGAFLLTNLGEKAPVSTAGLLTTVAWSLGGKRTYAFEGSAFIAGAAIQFCRDQLGILAHAADSEAMAQGAVGAPEVYFVPALAGLGAPHWDPRAQGAFLGLTRGTSKGQLVRAALEGIAFEVVELMEAMSRDLGKPVSVLRVDGGAAANDLLMQTQADLGGVPVDRPVNLETTAFGAALFAGLGVGRYSGLEELRNARRTARCFDPARGAEADAAVRAKRDGWQRAIRAVRVFAQMGSDPQGV